MKDERDFLKRLHVEFTNCPMWSDVVSVAMPDKRPDLEPNQIMVFIRPQNDDLQVVHAFCITVESLLFPPDGKPSNGQHRQPHSES